MSDTLPLPRRLDGPATVRLRGSRLARALLRLAGWRLSFDGLPGRQGLIVAYPHTSNWDFVVGLLAKWAFGLPLRFWAKDSLFDVPLFGAWLRWLGGVRVQRNSSAGLVADTIAQMRAAQQRGDFFWLALAPEGTRSLTEGWRSGFYHVAVQTGLPVGLAYLDFGSKHIGVDSFVILGGDPQADFALIAAAYEGRRGRRAGLAAPVRLKS